MVSAVLELVERPEAENEINDIVGIVEFRAGQLLSPVDPLAEGVPMHMQHAGGVA